MPKKKREDNIRYLNPKMRMGGGGVGGGIFGGTHCWNFEVTIVQCSQYSAVSLVHFVYVLLSSSQTKRRFSIIRQIDDC